MLRKRNPYLQPSRWIKNLELPSQCYGKSLSFFLVFLSFFLETRSICDHNLSTRIVFFCFIFINDLLRLSH